MKKYIVSGLLFCLYIVISFKNVFAYDLTLTSVGALSTLGVDYSLVNYSGGVPTLMGTASPSAQVGVRIKTLLGYTNASVSGVWQFIPTVLDQGDNSIVLSSGTQTISFTLRFNATGSATLSATPAIVSDESELPGSGVWEYYVPAVALGFGVIILGRLTGKKMQKWEKGD